MARRSCIPSFIGIKAEMHAPRTFLSTFAPLMLISAHAAHKNNFSHKISHVHHDLNLSLASLATEQGKDSKYRRQSKIV